MKHVFSRKSILLLVVALIFCVSPVHADTLDWNAVDWTNGNTTQSFDIGTTRVTVTITGNLNFVAGPDDTNLINGGTAGNESLVLAVNWPTDTSTVTVTVTFRDTTTLAAVAVRGLSYSIFDVDSDQFTNNTFRDQLTGISASNQGFAALSATVTGSTNNSVTGSPGTGVVVTGVNGGEGNEDEAVGNVNISYAATDTLTQFSFTYGNDPSAPNDPGIQFIGLGDFTFTNVPEPGTYVSAGLLVGCVAVHGYRRRRANLSS